MNLYGPIVTGRDVRRATETTVKTWIRDYLGEVSRGSGRATADLPTFRSYTSALDLDKFEEDQVPACVIVAPGIIDTPIRQGDQYIATWAVSVGVVVSGQNRENTFELCELYAAAVRALMIHHQSLGDFAQGVEWLGERYDELDSDDLRTIGAGSVMFGVDVYDSLRRYGGPDAPTPSDDAVTDPGDRATVGSVTITTERRS